ncbi:TIGR02234 family membrane protein [Tomitella biformata]|uniref:TIGR02234 family membrane protein n=1 Tax=Tomitella biformata TaxID=630403 RepID=UPI0004BC8E94|nr:TIGR02234 family membrane protein [Tomitella biformata]
MKSRRGLMVSTMLLVAAAALLWASSRLTWVEYTSVDGLRPPVEAALNGADWSPASTPLALLLIAGIAAMFAVRGWWVRVVGVLLALAGIGVAAQGVAGLFGDPDPAQIHSIAELSAGTEVTGAVLLSMPVLVTIVAGLLAIIASVPLITGGSGRQGLSSSYETPAARKEAAAESVANSDGEGLEQRQIWDALDAGADPTEDDEVSWAHPETRGDESDS